MRIDFSNIKDRYNSNQHAIAKGPGRFFCITCHKTLDEKNFFKSRREDKYPEGVLPECKSCVTMGVDDTDPLTFLPILKEINLPYMPTQWRQLVTRKVPGSPSILGKYVSAMRMNQYKKYSWNDSQNLVDEEQNAILAALRQETDNETEAEQKLEELMTFSDIRPMHSMNSMNNEVSSAALYGLTPGTSKYGLTQEEIDEYKMKWGNDYSEDEFLQLEQQLSDMQEAYVIQDPIAISNAKMICKMTLKMNKFLDIDDVESVSKLSRQLDLFIKTANLAPVQQKDRQQTTFAISQLAFLVEHEGGFIPQFYRDGPKDKIDQILLDMENYTEYLIHGETNIAEMVANTEAILAAEKDRPDVEEDDDDFEALERELLGDIEEINEAQEGDG